jgi:hypothetical protein
MLKQEDYKAIALLAESAWPNKQAVLRRVVAFIGDELSEKLYSAQVLLLVAHVGAAIEKATSPEELMKLLQEVRVEGHPTARLFLTEAARAA